MKGRGHSRYPVLGAIAAAVLMAAGALMGGRWPGSFAWPERPRVIVVGVGGLQWGPLLSLLGKGELPNLARILNGDHARGDLLEPLATDPAENLASVACGRFPWAHGIRTAADFATFDGKTNACQIAIWDQINRRGRAVAVLGFPLSYPVEGVNTVILPRGFKDEWSDIQSAVFAPSGSGDPGEDRLRGCMEGDVRLVSRAVALNSRLGCTALFVYLDGLAEWESWLDGRHPPDSAAKVDPAGYYRFIDRLMGQLAKAGSTQSTFILFSDGRAPAGADAAYRPRLAELPGHPPVGVFLAWGNGIRRGELPETPRPVDVAATILHMSGNPLPVTADGVVLRGILEDDYLFKNPLRFAP